MTKIPVGATIAHAYRFAFGNFLTVLKAIWIPLAIQLVLSVVVAGQATLVFAAFQARDPSATTLLGPLLLLYPLILILFFIQLAAATEIALGLREKTSPFYVPLGVKMWRLVAGYITAGLAVAVVMIAYLIVLVLLGSLLKLGTTGAKTADPRMVLSTLAAILVGYGGAIYLLIRFLFLLAPVNLTEKRLGVVRAWQLLRGNFWRAFLVVLSILLPIALVEYALIIAVAGWPPVLHGESLQAYQAARMAWNAAITHALATNWFIAMPLFAVLMVIYFGAGCAAQAFAYKLLTEAKGSASAPVAAD